MLKEPELKDLDTNFAEAKEKLAGLKELGIDVTTLEEKLNWAIKARNVMLKTKSRR